MINQPGRVVALALLLLAMPALPLDAVAQSSTPSTASTVPPSSASGSPSFEVASIRPNISGSSSSHSSLDNGRFTASNIQIKNLMEYSAYGIAEPRIVGGPAWLSTERFDIEAKVDSGTLEQLRTLGRAQRKQLTQALFQQLLADRFQLKAHWEMREQPVYALVATKKGSLLTPSTHNDASTHSSGTQIVATGLTMQDLASVLTQEISRELGRVVVDQTGIAGRYDLQLKWTPESESAAAGTAADAGPSIFTAVQEQLGLKLESKRAPVQVLVVDHIERPSAN